MVFTRYEYTTWRSQIRPGEFVRETGSCLFDAKGAKTMKQTRHSKWCETREEAQALLDARRGRESAAKVLRQKRDAAEAMYDALVGMLEVFGKEPNEMLWEVVQAQVALKRARGETP